MTKIVDLSTGNLDGIWRAIRALQNATPLNNASIGRSGLLVYDGGVITIENGGLVVSGTASISGFLNVTGTATISGLLDVTGNTRLTGQTDIWGPLIVTGDTDLDGLTTITGDTSITGNLDVTGPTTVSGTLDVTGAMTTKSTLSVEGVTTLKNDLDVTTGKIKAGTMTIDPSLHGGSIQFAGGGYLSGTASGPQLTGPAGNAFVYAQSALAGIQATNIKLAGATEVQGGLSVTSAPTSSEPANVYMDENGKIYRSIA